MSDIRFASALIDSGALLALLDRRDQWHSPCKAVWPRLRYPLLTSEAVLAETFHLVRSRGLELQPAWQLVSRATRLAPITHSELPQIHALMLKYADLPMDFADATLVYLAHREGVSVVFTTDQSDFNAYRLPGNRKLRIVPGL
jgi:uncharacterized protein